MTPDAMKALRDGHERFFAEPPDYEIARSLFIQVTQMCPKWTEGYHWLAASAEALGQIGEAEAAYRSAAECDPEDPRPVIALGRLLLEAGRFDEAVCELERGVKLKPHYCEADARLFLAEAYEVTGDLSNARTEWHRITQMEAFYPSYDEPMKEAKRKLIETNP